ncbi:MAG: alpha/beta hydrolase [Leptospira sp.]|nr:alpha/beta hydrolase [Leptospira sp.]
MDKKVSKIQAEILVQGYHTQHPSFHYEKPIRYCIVLWPSTGGNARAFRFRESELVDQRICLVRYNPISHGGVIGNYDILAALQTLKEGLVAHHLEQCPKVGIGHSGGGAALLKFAQSIKFRQLFLLSPILDSRMSLFYMYDNHCIDEFLSLLYPDSEQVHDPQSFQNKVERIHSLIGTKDWLFDRDLSLLDFPIQNSRIHVHSLSIFLKNLFLPGFNVENQLNDMTANCKIFLPNEDRWFPIAYTLKQGELYKIPIERIEKARDHFFSNSWIEVWKKIRSDLYIS